MPRHASEQRAKAFKNLDGSTKTVFVRPGGSDEANGLTTQSAFATLSRALSEVEKDFINGRYIIDITGCTIDEHLHFPQVRSGSFLETLQSGMQPDSYGAQYTSSLNIRATPTNILTLPARDPEGTGFENIGFGRWRLTFVAAAPNWTPSVFKGKFLRKHVVDGGTDFYEMVPIIDNGTDWITITDTSSFGVDGIMTIAEPGATIQIRSLSYVILDGLVGGCTVYGVRFQDPTEGNGDQGLVAHNCASLLFEACTFHASRIRAGGTGITRFFGCAFPTANGNPAIRLSGGSVLLDKCAVQSILFDSASLDAGVWGMITPAPSSLVIMRSYIDNMGEPGFRYYPADVVCKNSYIRYISVGAIFTGNHGMFQNVRFEEGDIWVEAGGFVELFEGCHFNGWMYLMPAGKAEINYTVTFSDTSLLYMGPEAENQFLFNSTIPAPHGGTWWRTVRGTDWGNECIIERYY